MNHNFYCVLDLETTSKYPSTTQIVQIASLMINPYKLEIVPGSEFQSLVNPIWEENIAKQYKLDIMDPGAETKHGKTREILKNAPSIESVWKNFVTYISQYGSGWRAPIFCGLNIKNFDYPILERVMKSKENGWGFGPLNKEGRQGIFHPVYSLDIMDQSFMFQEQNRDVNSLSADNFIRGYLGYSKGCAHDAISDVEMSCEYFIRNMKFIRECVKGIEWKGCLSE